MRWILVTFAVCAAVATANLYEDEDNAYNEEQNNIDVFLPRTLNKASLDRAVRSFYYSYWLYPGMAYKTRVPSAEMSLYMEPLTFQDVFEKPVLVVTPSPTAPNTFSMFYLHNGLRTLYRYQAFSWLQEFFKHPGLKGLIFYPHLIYNSRFFETPVTGVTVQEDLRMSDFVSIERCSNGRVPYMFVAPEEVFDRMHFENIAKVSDFKVYNDAIEVHPIIGEPRPMYEPFYGPNFSQAALHLTPAPQPSEPGAFRADYQGTIEQPELLAHSESLTPSQAGRGVYRGVAYGSGEPYGYGQNQFNIGQYNVKNGQLQSGFVPPEGYRSVNAAQAPFGPYQQVRSEAGVYANAAPSAVGIKDVYGTLMGSRAILQSPRMPTSEARFGAALNSAQFQAGGQVHYGTSKGTADMNSRVEAVNSQGGQAGISRVVEGSINGQLSGFGGAKLTGSHAMEESVQKMGNVLRTDSGTAQLRKVGVTSEGVSTVDVSSQQSVAGSVSRVELGGKAEVKTLSGARSGSHSSEQAAAIVYPKEGGFVESVGAQLQGGVGSGVQIESISRTGALIGEHSTESQVSGQYEVHSSGGSLQSGNFAKIDPAGSEGHAGVESGIAVNAGSISRSGGAEHVTESQRFSFSSTDPSEKLVRMEGNYGGAFGFQGGIGGKLGLSENVEGGLLDGGFGSGIVKTIDATTNGLGRVQKSSSVSSSSVSKSVDSNFGSAESSLNVETDSLNAATPLISSPRSLVSSTRTLMEDSTPPLEPLQ